MSACCLCSSLTSDRSRRSWDEPLFESANFVALASLGAMVEGWMLIVPRDHFLSMGALPIELANEVMEFRARVENHSARKYGTLRAFEHGPSRAKRQVGCGVDHAHLHLVPIDFDLISAAQPYLPSGLEWSNADLGACRAAHEHERDYLYIEQPLGEGRIAVHDELGSQIFRKAIADQLGIPEQFNWRDFPQFANIARTIEGCRAALAS